jgi:hypothetical protein
MVVDGKETAKLDIIIDSMRFHFFKDDVNVFTTPSQIKAVEYVNKWKSEWQDIVDYLKANGHSVEFKQNIR